MIEKILGAIHVAESKADGLKRMAPLVTGIAQIGRQEVEQLLAEAANLATATDLNPVPDEQGNWNTRLDLLVPVVQALLVRELKQVNEAREKDAKARAISGDPNATKAADEVVSWSDGLHQSVDTLYFATPPESELRCHLLRWLASGNAGGGGAGGGAEKRLRHWVQLLTDQPPEHRASIVLAFAPLMDATVVPPVWLLDDLIAGATGYSQIASAVYDLCNFYFRHGVIDRHPAEDRLEELNALLGRLHENLQKIESGQIHSGIDRQVLNRQVSDSVALTVALCDTFALTRYDDASAHLARAMSLRHRRVQTEAAAALARLGHQEGREALITLAQDPVSRLRVLAYADEQGFLDQISLEYQGEIAIAESRLAIWLSEPDQMGLAPSRIELLDSREMYWPSYDHPVVCYLFRFWYGATDNAFSNVGICGPMTHALSADLNHLSCDDLYAVFAGWQTTHQEIFYLGIPQAEKLYASEMRRLNGVMLEQELEDLEIETAASFFGQIVLIGRGSLNGQRGTAIADQQDITWVPESNEAAPINSSLAFALWSGRRLLSAFNQEDQLA